jgi:hypothetical protein
LKGIQNPHLELGSQIVCGNALRLCARRQLTTEKGVITGMETGVFGNRLAG